MSDRSTKPNVSTTRRALLRASVGIGTGGALASTGAATPNDAVSVATERTRKTAPDNEQFETPGRPSRTAYRALAQIERSVAQRSGSPSFDRVVNAVGYLGIGSNDPIDEALERADAAGDLDGVLLDFPPGTYRLSDGFSISPEGAFGIVGPRATFRLDSGLRCEVKIHGLSRGLFEGFTFDQRAGRAAVSVLLGTDGHIDVRDLTYRGTAEAVADDQGALLRPVAENRTASIRIDDLHARGGTNAGSHAWVGSDPPPNHVAGGIVGVFVGRANEGVVQFVDPVLHGWENALYATRTRGAVQVIGGRFVNNNNTAVRISGAESFCDGATIVLDARRWPESHPGEFTIGEVQGVSAVRLETGGLDKSGTRLRNLDVRAYAMQKCPGLIVYRGSAGAGRMRRCRLTNHLDGTPAIVIDPPGAGPYSAPPGSQAVRMDHIEIGGSMTGAPAVRGSTERSNSLLADSCLRIPDAGPDDVRSIRTRNVGYGADCTASQRIESQFGMPSDVTTIQNTTVQPPSPGPGLPGLGVLVGFGTITAYVMATLPPLLREKFRT
ncbi:hypothetical protein [Halococcus sp. PRR34]|uniref:hypothetical protein n=1 Tax=Halococcus sp. PRR34 TaxID=3020830 RepID=UPI00235E4C53|nr:hypothetical protein [Halococcus sp. PRR34]